MSIQFTHCILTSLEITKVNFKPTVTSFNSDYVSAFPRGMTLVEVRSGIHTNFVQSTF